MNEWTPLEEEIYRRGRTSSFLQLAKRFKITTDEVRDVYERAHIKFQTFDEEFKWNFNNGGRNAGAWSEEEMDVLRDAARRGATNLEVVGLLPKRKPSGILERYARAKRDVGIKKPRPWTEEDDEKLKVLLEKGESRLGLAVKLNRSPSFISYKLQNNNSEKEENPRSWTSEEMELIDRAVEDGMTATQAEDLFPNRTWKAIAVKMGQRRKELGLPATTKKWTKEDEREVIAGVLRGDSHAIISLRTGHGKGSVSAKVKELKKTGRLPDVDGRRRKS